MAIKALAWMVRLFEPPIYCYHQIVHNQAIVARFERTGVVFVGDIDDVPHGAPVMLSAHGAAPDVVAAVRARAGFVVDAVCPLVAKVHFEVRRQAAKGYSIIYVGHEGHDEADAAMAVAPGAMHLVESEADVAGMAMPDGPVALITQTALSEAECDGALRAAQGRFPALWKPERGDICFATTNRQSAVAQMAGEADAVVIVGSANSSNTMALVKVAQARGCHRTHRVEGPGEVPVDLVGVVGVTAGASTPDWLVHEVIERLAPVDGVEELVVTEEDEYFPLPRELRELFLKSVPVAGLRSGARPPEGWTLENDRAVPAVDMLRGLEDHPIKEA
jgi:4-hydroxy-3-methylbut-2-enyl diphosphate reductase